MTDKMKQLLEKEYPCEGCIIEMICNKSFLDNTACDKLKNAMIKVVKREQGLSKLTKYLKKTRDKK